MPENVSNFWGLGIIERRGAPAIDGVDVTAMLEQENNGFDVTAEGSKVKRRAGVVVSLIEINVLASKTQQGLSATTRYIQDITTKCTGD